VAAARQWSDGRRLTVIAWSTKEMHMPVILWLLGVPLVVIVVLMLLGVL